MMRVVLDTDALVSAVSSGELGDAQVSKSQASDVRPRILCAATVAA